VGVAYNQTITASGGTVPYTFAVTVGTLPDLLFAASRPAASDVARQILCLPIYADLPLDQVDRIADLIAAA